MASDTNEPPVVREAPYCLPHPEHGLVYLVFGSLAAGAPVYEPDPVETARRMARTWRWQQAHLFEQEAA